MSREKKSDEKVAKLLMRYMLPVGQKEYPIEVEVRFPHELNESVAREIRRLFWPFTPTIEKVNFPPEPEMEVEVEEDEEGDFTKIEVESKPSTTKAGRKTSSRSRG